MPKSRWGQSADIRALVLHVPRDLNGDSAGSGKVIVEARENLAESLQPTGEQTMRMPILRSAGPRSGRYRRAVAFQDLDLLEIFRQGASHRQPADTCPDH